MTNYLIDKPVTCPHCQSRNLYASIRVVQPLELRLNYSIDDHRFWIEGVNYDTPYDYDDRIFTECNDCGHELDLDEILDANIPTP